jgi:putative membrane protein
LEEQVFATRDRTGVLIFVALFEHRVEILADEGIDERVADDAWDRICDELTAGIRRGAPTEALIHAVDRCVELLVAHGVEADDAGNQLSDRPRFRDE